MDVETAWKLVELAYEEGFGGGTLGSDEKGWRLTLRFKVGGDRLKNLMNVLEFVEALGLSVEVEGVIVVR